MVVVQAARLHELTCRRAACTTENSLLGRVLELVILLLLLALGFAALVYAWRRVRIEEQLADAIDLLVAALRAGAGVMSALENSAQEMRRPLKPLLEELLGRIQYGDDPQAVFGALQARVPLETFRLFGTVLSVHWE